MQLYQFRPKKSGNEQKELNFFFKSYVVLERHSKKHPKGTKNKPDFRQVAVHQGSHSLDSIAQLHWSVLLVCNRNIGARLQECGAAAAPAVM